MYHRLLIVWLVVWQIGAVFLQRLAQPGHVAMAKYPENSGDKSASMVVPLAVLNLQKSYQRLGHCQTDSFFTAHWHHRLLLLLPKPLVLPVPGFVYCGEVALFLPPLSVSCSNMGQFLKPGQHHFVQNSFALV